ncbi:MAG: DUF4198 domain-containing protein [Gemmatimonadota bacterium]|nr:DUF4198 domain-containing protein [Gemmatimonadota bacterium]
MKIDRRVLITAGALALTVVATARAHDMFLKLESFYLSPNSSAVVSLMNGTFDESMNVITRDRMADVSIVSPSGVARPPASAWRDTAMHHWDADSVDTALLTFETGEPGTYAIGVSTNPTVFTLSAQDFNEYLEHDGVVDALDERKAAGKMDEEATERYSKHVKALVQVGDARSGEFAHELGYPVEFVPLANPYELGVGDELQVRFLSAGEPVANQIVYASHEGYHGHDEEGEHTVAVTTRTNADGIATIPLDEAGRWFVRTIHMVETTSEPDVDYESNWATLTFEIR